MKLLQTFALLIALGATALAADLQQLLSEGQTAMIRGDLPAAKRAFQMAYQIDPRNAVAIGYLKQIAVQEQKGGGAAAIERQFASVIMPEVQFKDATFGAALEALKKKVSDASKGTQAANFVVQAGVDQNAPVTLSLTNIPFTEALRYLVELVNAKVEYQKYAIVIRPAGATASNPQPVQAPR